MSSARVPRTSYDVMFYLPSITPLLVESADQAAGGAETQILLLARALARRGVKVCLVAFPSESRIPRSMDGVDIVVRRAYSGRVRLLGKLREAERIWRAVSQVSAETVVVRVAGTQVGLVALVAKLRRQRFVYSSAHVFDFDVAGLRMKRRNLALYKLGLRIADEVVVQTEEQVQSCESQFGRSPILIRSIAELAERRESPEAVLWIGRLVWYKQPLLFVELARALPDIKFRMVCVPTPESGSLLQDVHQAAADVPNLELFGPSPRARVLDLIDRAAAVVNTSDSEGMSNIFLEAWARGVPALAFSHDPDSLIERNGLGEVAYGSVENLLDATTKLWNERSTSSALAQRCRQYIRDEHAADRIAAQWEQALGRRAPEPAGVAVEGVA
jgi:glycosyltransferase involved in cell wall biosynthesis